MRHKRAWTMPVDEARTFLQHVQEKIASSDIEVAHRDVLIRLRSIIEEDREAAGQTPQPTVTGAVLPSASTRRSTMVCWTGEKS